MSANVETMFYVREKPWHGLGTLVMEAPASADALVWAGLDWQVIQKEVSTEDGDRIAGYKANVRSTDGSVLGIVSDRYKVVQNEDAFRFTDEHRKELNEMDSNEEIVRYLDQQNVVGKFADFANRRGLRRRNLMLYKSRKLFKLVIYGNIINNVKDTSQFYEYINSDDPTVEHAVTLLKEGKSFPQAPKDSIAETVKKK